MFEKSALEKRILSTVRVTLSVLTDTDISQPDGHFNFKTPDARTVFFSRYGSSQSSFAVAMMYGIA